MSWIDKLRRARPDDEHKQLLFFSTGDLINENYAVVRTTWYEERRLIAFLKLVFIRTTKQCVIEMRDIIKCALQAGADVSLICVETPDDLGLRPA